MADLNVTQFTNETAPVGADLLYLAKSPFAAGDDRKVTLTNFFGNIAVAPTPATAGSVALGSALKPFSDLFLNNDLTIYDAVNDGNPNIFLGSSAAERFVAQAVYDSGAQTLDYVKFSTEVASATANKGKFSFWPDGVNTMDFVDTGIQFLQATNEIIIPDAQDLSGFGIKDTNGYYLAQFRTIDNDEAVEFLNNTILLQNNATQQLIVRRAGSATIQIHNNTEAPAGDTILGGLNLSGQNDNSEQVNYAELVASVDDDTDGAEYGNVNLTVLQNGTKLKFLNFVNSQLVVTIPDNAAIGAFQLVDAGSTSYIQADTTDGLPLLSLMGSLTVQNGSMSGTNLTGAYGITLNNGASGLSIGTPVGAIQATGKNSNDDTVQYGSFSVSAFDDTQGAEYGALQFGAMVNGSTEEVLTYFNLSAVTGGAINVDSLNFGSGGIPLLLGINSGVGAGTWTGIVGQEGEEVEDGAGNDGGDVWIGSGQGSDAATGDTDGGDSGNVYSGATNAGAASGGGAAGAVGKQFLGYVPFTSVFSLPFADVESNLDFINGLGLKKATATAAVTASATITIATQVPSGAVIVGARIRVDSALTGGETWDAAYATGATQSIATNQAVAQNTKVKKFFNANAATNIASAATDIAITKNGGGSFTAQGSFTGEVYYYELEDIASV